MSLAVTSSITWWFLRPLMAANMPRIIGASAPFGSSWGSGDLRDRGRVDTIGAAHGEGRLSVLGGDLLDGAGVLGAVLVLVGHGAAQQADGVAARVLARQVRDLLERGERGHLAHEVRVLHRVHGVLMLQLGDEELQELVLAHRGVGAAGRLR